MRYTLLPPASELEFLDSVHSAVPERDEEPSDCCARLVDQVGLDSRDRAREWLVFLQALGCVAEDETGSYRVAGLPTDAPLADQFEQGVFGATEVQSVLERAETPLTAVAVLERLDDGTRRRLGSTAGPGPDTAEEHVSRLLDWGVQFGSATRCEGGYESADRQR